MRNFKIRSTTGVILLASILFCSGCTVNPSESPQDLDNSLTKVWTGPHNGVPAFNEMTLEDLKPALNQAMAINLTEIEKITNQSTTPNFDNTIVALERTGKVLDRVFTYYGIWSSNLSSPEFRKIEEEMAPIMSAFFSKINQNQALFNRVKAVYENLGSSTLRADQQRLVTLTYNGFARNGAMLS
ncbi:MAG: M3 family peptidase, partial [Porticoccaceae bacterium]|nr:M3 family peptidase [Porticoccaceae bacterium]